MALKIEKRPGPDWDIYYTDLADGARECMSVFGCATPEDAIAEARASFSGLYEIEDENGLFEILAVVRKGIDIDAKN